MKNKNQKIAIAGLLCAIGVVGSLFSFPILGSKCAPIQHMVNIICAVLLGPTYGVCVAFVTSLIRNIAGLGSVLAFPGSMFGALIAGVVFKRTKNTWLTYLGEVFGTGILGGAIAYPVAILVMGKSVSDIAFYVYIIPFLISSIGGAILSAFIVESLKKRNVLDL
ncbi:MAG: energy coupling factor transporter S component ThiW [Lachnospirales bacterium]